VQDQSGLGNTSSEDGIIMLKKNPLQSAVHVQRASFYGVLSSWYLLGKRMI
jgi:hypothetical protein